MKNSPTVKREVLAHLWVSLITIALWGFALWIDPTYFWWDDMKNEILPASFEIIGALKEGSWPLLSPHVWFGTNLAGEFRYGVFSLFQIASYQLSWSFSDSLPRVAAILVLIYLTLLANGGYRLARVWGATFTNAAAAALVLTFNGWMFKWGARSWLPALVTFAWLPWFAWALRVSTEASRRTHGLLAAGVFLHLIIAGGWPYTILMAAAFCLFHVWESRQRISLHQALAGVLIAVLIGAGLSAPAWMSLLEYYPSTARAEVRSFPDALIVPWKALAGIVWPGYPTTWFYFMFDRVHPSLELFGATIPFAASAWAIAKGRRGTWLCLFLLGLLALSLSMAPLLPPFRWSFRFLPLFFLGIGIAGSLVGPRNTRWASLLLAGQLASSALTIWLARDLYLPRWNDKTDWMAAQPLEPGRRYLFLAHLETLWHWDNTRVGNTPMLQGLEFINGYSPMAPAGLYETLGLMFNGWSYETTARAAATPGTPVHRFLDHAAVDSLLVGEAYRESIPPLLKRGWRDGPAHPAPWRVLVRDSSPLRHARPIRDVWSGSSPSPRGMTTLSSPREEGYRRFSDARIIETHSQRHSAEARVQVNDPQSSALILFSRPWVPGYRASVDGVSAPIQIADRVFPAVEVPSGAGIRRVRIEFRPWSVRWGVGCAVITLLGCIAWPNMRRTRA